MGLLFADGFDSYSASSELVRNWSGASTGSWTWNATAGRLGGGAIVANTAVASQLWMPMSQFSIAAGTVIGTGFWLKVSAAPASVVNLYSEYAPSSGIITHTLALNINGTLRLTDNGAVNRAGGSTNVCDNAWHWIEDYSPGSSNATYKAYVDGVVQWNGTFNINTVGTPRTTALFYAIGATLTLTIDDFLIFDNTSPGPVASAIPIGPRQISTLYPSADGTVQFTPSTGVNNFAMVDEVAGNDDTDYVQDGTSAHADEYEVGNLGFVPVSINSVQLVSRVKNPGAGTISYKGRAHSGATVSSGSAVVAPSSYQNSRTIYNQDPDTLAAWTGGGVDAAKFGIEVV